MFSPFAFNRNKFVIDGLISLYNPASLGGYDTGSNTIVDLWGSNDLETAGDPVNVESDGAIYFFTGSYASSSAELSADLLNASAEFTILVYSYQTMSGSAGTSWGNGRFKIGGAGRNNTTNVIGELADDRYPICLGATTSSFSVFENQFKTYEVSIGSGEDRKNVRYQKSNYLITPPYPESTTSSSFAAYVKADQSASYTLPNTNLSVYLDNCFIDAGFSSGSKSTVGLGVPTDFSEDDLYIEREIFGLPDVFGTNLAESYLVLNPTFTAGGGAYAEPNSFALKGFAVYNRALSTTEIQIMKSWFDQSYQTYPNDPDAQAFIDATGISGTEATAINTLVLDLKADNLWDKMKVIYPMVGGTSDTMKYNLVDPQDTDAAYRIDWVGSSTTFNSDGVTFPQLTSDYGKTYINLSGSTDFDPTQGHISIYNRGYSLPPANSYLIGFRDSSSPNFNNTIFLNTISGSISNWNGGTSLVGTLSGVTGLIMANRVVTTAIENWRNGVLEINNTSVPWYNRATDIQMTIGAQNRINTDTSPGTISTTFPTSANVAFVSVGDGLDNTEAANLYTAVQTFQTTLSRQV